MSSQTEKLFEVEIAEIRKDFEYLSKQMTDSFGNVSKTLDAMAEKLNLLSGAMTGQADLQRQINHLKDDQDKKHEDIMRALEGIKQIPTDMALVKKFIEDQETINENYANFMLQTKIIVGAIGLTTTILTIISASWGSIRDLAK